MEASKEDYSIAQIQHPTKVLECVSTLDTEMTR